MPYCSRECQVADWKSHKLLCSRDSQESAADSASKSLGQLQLRKGGATRTELDIYNDMRVWAEAHNGDTLTVTAWHALELTKDITKSLTHFMALTVRKNDKYQSVRAMYSFDDVAVLPIVLIANKAGSVVPPMVGQGPPILEISSDHRAEAIRDGHLGSVMVMTFELAPDEKMSPEEAVRQKSMFVMQPLRLFEVHRTSLRRLPSITRSPTMWRTCLKNSLDGGAWSFKYQPWP